MRVTIPWINPIACALVVATDIAKKDKQAFGNTSINEGIPEIKSLDWAIFIQPFISNG